MTVKGFFKSNIFKCLITLLCVLLVSGIFLTVMNGLLAVTDEERFDRAINKIYGKSVKTESVQVADYNSNATIVEAYRVKDDGNYLVKSTGKGGYDNGTVTCWVVVEVKGGKVSGVGKVVIDSNKAQSYIDRVTDKALSQFGELYEPGIYYTQDLITNATVKGTKTAICNAVNGAVDFVNALFGNVTEDIYAEFAYIENIQTTQSSHKYDEETGNVIFTVVSKGYGHAGDFTSEITVGKDGKIVSFNIVKYGSTGPAYDEKAAANAQSFVGKDLDGLLAILGEGVDGGAPAYVSGKFPTTGASESTYSLYNAALFAAANYDKCMPADEQPENPEGGEGDETPEENGGDTEQGGDNNE